MEKNPVWRGEGPFANGAVGVFPKRLGSFRNRPEIQVWVWISNLTWLWRGQWKCRINPRVCYNHANFAMEWVPCEPFANALIDNVSFLILSSFYCLQTWRWVINGLSEESNVSETKEMWRPFSSHRNLLAKVIPMKSATRFVGKFQVRSPSTIKNWIQMRFNDFLILNSRWDHT